MSQLVYTGCENKDLQSYLNQVEKINQDLTPVVEKQTQIINEKSPHYHDPNFGDQSQMMEILQMYITALTNYIELLQQVLNDEVLPKQHQKTISDLVLKKVIDVLKSYKEIKEAYIFQSNSIMSRIDIHILATITSKLTNQSLLELMESELSNQNTEQPKSLTQCCVIV